MRDRILETMLDLIGIDSDNRADKAPIVEYARRRLLNIGMEVSVVGPEGRPALCASYGSGGIVLSGHLDTVPIGEGWTREQGETDHQRVYGRGTSDMKGAVAVMLEAARALVEEDIAFSVYLTTDEEEGMLGALDLAQSHILRESNGLVIGEPTGMKIVSKEKGVYRIRLTTRGKAGHSSQPWLGENAILKAHRILSNLDDIIRPPREPTEELTASVTTIKGGTKDNVIPESCSLEIDIRFPPWETIDGVKRLLEGRISKRDCETEVTAELESFEAPRASDLIEEARRYLKTEMFAAAFATEAARFASVNPNIVICGPGMPGTCHIVDEWVDVGDLERFYNFIIHMARYASQG